MCAAIYNAAISEAIVKPVVRNAPFFVPLRARWMIFFFVMMGTSVTSAAADWNAPEQQLARKIVAVTGPGAVSITVNNRSSLGRRDVDIVQNGLRSALSGVGLRFVTAEQAAATVTITLSENTTSYVWVAEIHQGVAEPAVVMVSTPRAGGAVATQDSVPIVLRKIPLWTQEEPILDVAVLEESSTPTRIAVLSPDKVSLCRLQGGKWQVEQEAMIVHPRPWPRDLRGRLIPAKDHLLDAYLPGMICRSIAGGTLALTCSEAEDPWPLVASGFGGEAGVFTSGSSSRTAASVPAVEGFFSASRNFFTGALTPAIGKFTAVPKFYSAALLPRDKYVLWLFATTDGQVHQVDGLSDQAARFDWGSDIASVKTSCGSGWQLLATSSGERSSDSVRAFEFPDRDPIAVSAPVDFAGAITALWTEARGDAAIVVARNSEAGIYESFRLALACGQ